jgi:hypothetical protein
MLLSSVKCKPHGSDPGRHLHVEKNQVFLAKMRAFHGQSPTLRWLDDAKCSCFFWSIPAKKTTCCKIMFGNAKYGGTKSISQILNMIICARLIPNLELESPMISLLVLMLVRFLEAKQVPLSYMANLRCPAFLL